MIDKLTYKINNKPSTGKFLNLKSKRENHTFLIALRTDQLNYRVSSICFIIKFKGSKEI